VTNAALNIDYTSSAFTVDGINVGTAISISGGSGKYSINGAAWETTAGSVYQGDSIRVQLRSAVAGNTTTSTTLTIGGISTGYSITTLVPDNTPDAFIFQDVSDATLNTQYISDTITISGINTPTPISIT
jgi:hypothetical protein